VLVDAHHPESVGGRGTDFGRPRPVSRWTERPVDRYVETDAFVVSAGLALGFGRELLHERVDGHLAGVVAGHASRRGRRHPWQRGFDPSGFVRLVSDHDIRSELPLRHRTASWLSSTA
jgi:hypothetical protein